MAEIEQDANLPVEIAIQDLKPHSSVKEFQQEYTDTLKLS